MIKREDSANCTKVDLPIQEHPHTLVQDQLALPPPGHGTSTRCSTWPLEAPGLQYCPLIPPLTPLPFLHSHHPHRLTIPNALVNKSNDSSVKIFHLDVNNRQIAPLVKRGQLVHQRSAYGPGVTQSRLKNQVSQKINKGLTKRG